MLTSTVRQKDPKWRDLKLQTENLWFSYEVRKKRIFILFSLHFDELFAIHKVHISSLHMQMWKGNKQQKLLY